MTPARAIALVAGREMRARMTSRTFIVTTAVLVGAIVVGGLLLGTQLENVIPTQQVGLTSATEPLGPTLRAAGPETGVVIETRVTNEATGEALLLAGTLDALLTGTASEPTLVVRTEIPGLLSPALAILAQQLALNEEITALGGDPAQVALALANASRPVRALEAPEPVEEERSIAGMIGGILIFVAITITGQLVAQGVVEEKTSRVVELLLSTIRPWELMAGKVAGIGAVGFTQLLLIGGAAAGTAATSGALDGTEVNLTSAFVWIIVWFVLGYVMYSLVLAALSALVSRQEDVGSVITPVILIMMIPYFIGVTVGVNDPANPLITNLSRFPFFSPFLMPIRITTGNVAGLELALTVVLAAAVLPVLVWAAGRVYGNAVLRTGARVSLREAIRAG